MSKSTKILIIISVLVVAVVVVGWFLLKNKSQEITWVGIVTEKNDSFLTVQVKSEDNLFKKDQTVIIKNKNLSIEEPMNVLDLVEKGKSIYDKDYKPSDISKINKDDLLEISSNKILFKISHKKARILKSSSLFGFVKEVNDQTFKITPIENPYFGIYINYQPLRDDFEVKNPSQIKKIVYDASSDQKSKPTIEDINFQDLKPNSKAILIYDNFTKKTISEPKTIVILAVINQPENKNEN